MVSFYKPAKSSKKTQTGKTVTVQRWDMTGQGVCNDSKPVLFVDGALPGEKVDVLVTQQQKRFARASVKKILTSSPHRVTPFCDLADRCGGCQLQHADADAALTYRQEALDSWWKLQFGLDHIPWTAAVTGERRGYRRKARLATDARNDKQFKLGYREEQGKQVVDVDQCPVLQPGLSALIAPLKALLSGHSARKHVGHVTLLAGDNMNAVSVRLTKPMSPAFGDALTAFAVEHKVNMTVEGQEGTLTLHEEAELYCTTEPGLSLSPAADDFVQVNGPVNAKMVAQAMEWLNPQPGEKIADWFSGLGNFSLSLAKRGAQVQAVEGVAEMVQRAKENASKQGVDNVNWLHLDLSDEQAVAQALSGGFDKLLLDPSREGAYAVCESLTQQRVKSILYVSCNPGTLTRDAQCLLASGYAIERVGLIEMFPQTRHLEVMMLLTDHKNKA